MRVAKEKAEADAMMAVENEKKEAAAKARQRAEEAKQAKEAAAIAEQAAYEAKIAERRRSLKPFQH